LKLKSIIRNNRGIALLLTVSVTTILVAASLEYNRQARASLVSTAAMRDSITLSQMSASGVHLAMAMLIKDKYDSTTDSMLEDWADSVKIDELLEQIPFEDGKIAVNIVDEMGKIQANALVAFPEKNAFNETQLKLWERFLNNMIDEEEQLPDDSRPEAITNSVKDWLDSGDDDAVSGLSGAESEYYQDLDPPYACRNAPLVDLEELMLIKGITPELFYGREERPGMAQFLTIYGVRKAGEQFAYPGKININTASLPVLAALLPMESQDLIDTLKDHREAVKEEKEDHDFSNPGWYKNLPGFGDVDIDKDLITTSSDIFEIVSESILHEKKLNITAVVQRVQDPKSGKWYCKILSWKSGPGSESLNDEDAEDAEVTEDSEDT
jgi:general secretion pathway protein K